MTSQTWYAAEHHRETTDADRSSTIHQQLLGEQRFLSMPEFPFRVVTVNKRASAPYPEDDTTEQPFMIDHLSGDRWHRGGTIRQPVAEDFLRPHHPLSPPPVEDYDSDQDLPVIEPNSFIIEPLDVGKKATPQPFKAYFSDQVLPVSEPASYLAETQSQGEHSPSLPGTAGSASNDVLHMRPESAIDTPRPLHVAIPRPASERSDTPVRVPTMGSDMFSPALGGLHRLPSTPGRKPPKRERLKRLLLCDDRRKYGHGPH